MGFLIQIVKIPVSESLVNVCGIYRESRTPPILIQLDPAWKSSAGASFSTKSIDCWYSVPGCGSLDRCRIRETARHSFPGDFSQRFDERRAGFQENGRRHHGAHGSCWRRTDQSSGRRQDQPVQACRTQQRQRLLLNSVGTPTSR